MTLFGSTACTYQFDHLLPNLSGYGGLVLHMLKTFCTKNKVPLKPGNPKHDWRRFLDLTANCIWKILFYINNHNESR